MRRAQAWRGWRAALGLQVDRVARRLKQRGLQLTEEEAERIWTYRPHDSLALRDCAVKWGRFRLGVKAGKLALVPRGEA